jgi:hypothetical protein
MEEANCRISQDCKWNQNPTTGNTADRCEEKPCDQYWFKASCPSINSKEGAVRDNACKWESTGLLSGKCTKA